MAKGGKKQAPQNSSGNNKDMLLKKAEAESLERKINEYRELLSEIEDWRTKRSEKETELQVLTDKVSIFGEADSIISQKEDILKSAVEEKAIIEAEAKIVKAEIEDNKILLKDYENAIGVYENADDIIISAKQKAEAIIAKANEEAAEKLREHENLLIGINNEKEKILGDASASAKEIAAAAEKEAQVLVDAAKAQAKALSDESKAEHRDALKEKNTILSDAKTSAEIIINEAKQKVEEYYSCKVSEGEAQKDAVISTAQQERNQIIDNAHKDAETICDSIKSAADDYAKKTRETAEKQGSYIIEQAEKIADEITAAAEAERQNARDYAKKVREKANEEAIRIKEEAYLSSQEVRDKLEENLDAATSTRAEYEAKLKELQRRKIALDQREDSLDEEIADRVEKECNITAERQQQLQDFCNNLYKRNKELEQNKRTELEIQTHLINSETIEVLKQQLDELKAKGITIATADEFVRARNDLLKAADQIDRLKVEKANMAVTLRESSDCEEELRHEKDRNKYFSDMVKALEEELDKSKAVSREEMIAPMKAAPALMLGSDLDDDRDIGNEIEWLNHIQNQCDESGLKFCKRQIYAYHTAQKIKDMSPLVVLAGVSGTGKSELPKNYAIHGGMNFLSIPVKPDWDSPTSLFGYYNSIERRFEATELVRALYQMSKDEHHKQQMMMVLLDEMNLAHPEQYFADLLSKLETCRGMSDYAQYDILLGGGERPEHLDIGPNILWTGTMNEDETTKGLSDKVIDRSTLITFPRPTELYDRKEITEVKSTFILSKKKWNEWCAQTGSGEITENRLAEYKKVVQSINDQMSVMGRNLGHRVWQGMAKYILHHPTVIMSKNDDELTAALDKAFCDSIAFKVMPKLRGVEVRGQNEEALSKIESILTASAGELVPDYNNARTLTTELFQWCSADFMNRDDE